MRRWSGKRGVWGGGEGRAGTLLITRNRVKTEKLGRNHVSPGLDVPLDGDFELIELLVAPGTRASYSRRLGCGRPRVFGRGGVLVVPD